jgi:uncharacterized repeat protein (TIGR04076 family)
MAARVSKENFEAEVLQASTPVLVEFYSDSCIPCKQMSPILGDIEDDYEDRLKVVKVNANFDGELAEQYAIPNLGKCPFHQKGQVLYSDGINPPDGMCGVAWQVIAPMARQLSLGELVQTSGTWLNDDTIGVVACPDGIRPVIFLLEAE